MPTKRQFDMVIITVLLLNAATALPRYWAKRTAADDEAQGPIDTIARTTLDLVAS